MSVKHYLILLGIGLTHLWGSFFIYDVWPNFDLIMHAGTATLLSYIINDLISDVEFLNKQQKLFFVFAWILILGVVWELMEFIWNQTVAQVFPNAGVFMTLPDTLLDLIMDSFGFLIFLFFITKVDK